MEHEYFKKAAVIHGVFSLALLALFGVGFHHTQNTDWDGSAPYWAFGAITGFMHFLCIFCAVNCYGKRNSDTGMKTALGIYRIFSCILRIWSFLGTVGTGVTGACADLGECAYQENQGVNKGMAITMLVLHIISFVYACIINVDVRTLYKDGPKPKPGPTLKRPYNPGKPTTRSVEPPAYNIPLPISYNILPPPNETLPSPPLNDSRMPELRLTLTEPTIAVQRPHRLPPLQLQGQTLEHGYTTSSPGEPVTQDCPAPKPGPTIERPYHSGTPT